MRFQFADGAEGLEFQADRPAWKPSDEQWEAIRRRSLERPATVAVVGVRRAEPDKLLSAASIAIRTSRDEVGAPIFYREVTLPFLDAVRDPSRIRWRFGPISSKKQPPVVLGNLPTCGNCHSFSADGGTLGMDVDSANDKGSYVIAPVQETMVFDADKVITWSDYRREDGQPTFGLLAQVSPDGRHAVGMVKDRHVTVSRPELMISQLFFPVKGILAVYDRQQRRFSALPGADDRKYVHGSPAWSPDGKHIVFARARACDLAANAELGMLLVTEEAATEFLEGGKKVRFRLHRIPFADGKGGKARPLAGASHNGMSNYFPKWSPDGKWIVFCKADSFMLLQPDSELYIIPAEGGEARRMRCNLPRLNSWHSWSPNGRWLVFSSKLTGPYTQLFLTHVDDAGRDTPPVLLENFTFPQQKRAANIPEFVNVRPGAIKKIRDEFLDAYCYYRSGTIAMQCGDPALAVQQYRRAVELDPKDGKARFRTGLALAQLGRHAEAAEAYAKAIPLLDEPAEAYSNLGNAQLAMRKPDQAMASYALAIRGNPKLPEPHYNLGLAYLRTGRQAEAIAAWEKAVALKDDYVEAYANLGTAHLLAGRALLAMKFLNKAIALDPDNALTHHSLAAAQAEAGNFPQAVRHEQTALRLAEAAGNAPLAQKARQGLTYYRQGKSFRGR